MQKDFHSESNTLTESDYQNSLPQFDSDNANKENYDNKIMEL